MMGRGDLLSPNFPEGINREGKFWKVVIEEKETWYGVTGTTNQINWFNFILKDKKLECPPDRRLPI